MAVIFQVKRVEGPPPQTLRAYWVESTASINVDGPVQPAEPDAAVRRPAAASEGPGTPERSEPLRLAPLPAEEAIQEMADYLNAAEMPEIVMMIHGFNSPLKVVQRRFQEAFLYLNKDPDISRRGDLVCIGYRWPSEPIGAPARSTLSAAPGFLLTIGVTSLILLLLNSVLLAEIRHPLWWYPLKQSIPILWRVVNLLIHLRPVLYVVGLLLFAVPLAAFLLRAAVYFRDVYRASQYGVPDLVEVIRQLDRALNQPSVARRRTGRVKLSFIGHSMGAFVVTSLVRILSDVFGATTVNSLQPDSTPDFGARGDIGTSLCLGRLVLASPDIPAEALLTRRANFLGPSLRRCEEAHLFSNEGDVVLRIISTLANYFSFPSGSRKNGFRLGNVEVVDPDEPLKRVPPFGINNLSLLWEERENPDRFLKALRVGELTLDKLDGTLHSQREAIAQGRADSRLPRLPECFNYFDCTDYRDEKRSYLTRGLRRPKLGPLELWRLLFFYIFPLPGTVDVHSGYFDGPLTQKLIYRLACLGFRSLLDTPELYGRHSLDDLDAECRREAIQVLLSPIQHATLVWETLLNGAAARADGGDGQSAALLLAKADAVCERAELGLTSRQQEVWDRTLETAHKAADEEAFATGWEVGRTLSLQDAITRIPTADSSAAGAP